MNAFQSELHDRALAISKQFHQSEADLIEILQKIDEARVYLELGYSSLFEYARSALRLSEANAYAFTRISRKAKEIPVLKEEIRAGNVTVSNAKQILPVLTDENKDSWIEKAKSLSKRDLEKEIVRVRPDLAPTLKKKELVKIVTPERVSVRVELSEEAMNKIRRVQVLLSSSGKANASIEEVMNAALDLFLDKKDPVKKAERGMAKNEQRRVASALSLRQDAQSSVEKSWTSAHSHFPRGKRRSSIPARVRHEVFSRDHGKCAYEGVNGNKCESDRYLELHHLKPVSLGGPNSTENIATLCGAHHKHTHRDLWSPSPTLR